MSRLPSNSIGLKVVEALPALSIIDAEWAIQIPQGRMA